MIKGMYMTSVQSQSNSFRPQIIMSASDINFNVRKREDARSRLFHPWSQVSPNVLPSSLVFQIGSLFHNHAKYCVSKFFEEDAMSLEQYADIVKQYRSLKIAPPEKSDVRFAEYLINDLFLDILPEPLFKVKNVEKLLENEGIFKTSDSVYKLVLLFHGSQKDPKPCGGMIMSYPKKKTFSDIDYLYIDTLAIRRDFQNKAFSRLLLSYAQKFAKTLHLQELQLFTNNEGTKAYIPYGFAPCGYSCKLWDSYSLSERFYEVKGIRNRRLYFCLNDNSAIKMSKEKLLFALSGK